jgi:hypothetical protein
VVQLSATRCSCIAILWVSLVSFAAITLCVASQRVFIVVYFVMTQSGNFWIQPRITFEPFVILKRNSIYGTYIVAVFTCMNFIPFNPFQASHHLRN